MTARAQAAWRLFSAPATIGGRRYPSIGLVLLAAIGACFLIVVAVGRWGAGQDQEAYWQGARRLLDGLPLYDPTATSVTPFAYWYPPPLAQVLVPVAAVVPARIFDLAWVALLLGCLLWMARWRPLVALAYVAFVPVAVELWFDNVHLVLAALIVLGIRRWPWAFTIGAAIKIAPGLGILYLLLRRRWREAGIAIGLGLVILIVSVVIGPNAWSGFLTTIGARGPADISGFLPIPYVIRLVAAVGLTVLAATMKPRWGEPLLVVAITVALPTLWLNALATLIAIVPIASRRGLAADEDEPVGVGIGLRP
ncbi:MAG TPA: glycosyltransferase 87 family protein [Candidatus Limnocylindrales bacterium]|nr:glycosyltransferase 87 family protein [Candidatus Limnocylindrales bacterium]